MKIRKISKNKGKDYLYWREGGGETAEIVDIAVKSERRKGVGREMVDEMLTKTQARRIYAITRASNAVAQMFYMKTGFTSNVLLPDFYPDEDGIMYIRCV